MKVIQQKSDSPDRYLQVDILPNAKLPIWVVLGITAAANIRNLCTSFVDPKKTFNGSWPETVCASFRLLLSIAIQLCFISAVVKLFTQRIDRHKQALRAGLEKR